MLNAHESKFVLKYNRIITSARWEKHFLNCNRFDKEIRALIQVVTIAYNKNGCFTYKFNIEKLLAQFWKFQFYKGQNLKDI